MKKKICAAIALLSAVSLAACGGSSAASGSHSSAGSKTDTAGSSASASTVTADSSAESGTSDTVKKGSGKLIVYSALNEDNTIALADQFKKDTGIDIQYISLGGGDAVARVQAEMSNPKADFLVGGSVDLYGSLLTPARSSNTILPIMIISIRSSMMKIITGRDGTWVFSASS